MESDMGEPLYNNKSRDKPSIEGRVDPTYGQRSALPGLDEDPAFGGDDELSYDDDMDAISYLRSVRQEAIGIPNLLVAPNSTEGRDIYEKGAGEYRGRYADGAYYAPGGSPRSTVDDMDYGYGAENPQTTYYASIISRFQVLRQQLQQRPPEEAVAALDADHPTSLGRLEMAVVRWWKWKMRTSDPLPVQIASMDKGTVLKLLVLITNGNSLKRGTQVEVSISRWVWALLARLPERGELMSEEIGVVRDLAKKSVLIGTSLCGDQKWDEQLRELENNDVDKNEDICELEQDSTTKKRKATDEADENIPGPVGPVLPPEPESKRFKMASKNPEEAPMSTPPPNSDVNASQQESGIEEFTATKERIPARLHELVDTEVDTKHEDTVAATNSRWNTKATVDMIITIAGEMYGQRDLLEARLLWEDVI
ncbi:hypothetical protein BJ878DRAFT_441135 [Calycina marina]|uniref:Uncharacterized protein n=1 Tax=Calycina marina TaxID=1763456 RepID=A0A9P7Z392_9HELO|nr:hypothetical protein BJ878DRAFT_441135 [Calycina marina]